MTMAVAILMKDPAKAKTRLRKTLDSDTRESLALAMFENTLNYFARSHPSLPIAVISPSPRIAAIARSHGAEPVEDEAEGGINQAASGAAYWALTTGAPSLLIIHADIPTLADQEIAAVMKAGSANNVVIAESTDGGTNALLVSPPDALPFRFGPKSAAAHEEAARAAGLTALRLKLPFLSRDLDTPDDLRFHQANSMAGLHAFAVPGIPEIQGGDDLGDVIADAFARVGITLEARDVIAVAQKIVSKSEFRMRRLSDFTPSARATEIAHAIGKDPRKVEAILSESVKVLRLRHRSPDGLLITRHRNGWICANAGIDESNLGAGMEGMVLLLPEDADRSARVIQAGLQKRFGCEPGVVVTDTFGRPWRQGLVNVAIGVAGIPAVVNWAGRGDANGRVLKATAPAFADEVAAAAGLLMPKDAGIPVVLLRGLQWDADAGASARDILRPTEQELFL